MGLDILAYKTELLEPVEDVCKEFAWYLNEQVKKDMHVFTRLEMTVLYEKFRDKNTLIDEEAEEVSNWIGSLPWEDDTVGLIFDY